MTHLSHPGQHGTHFFVLKLQVLPKIQSESFIHDSSIVLPLTILLELFTKYPLILNILIFCTETFCLFEDEILKCNFDLSLFWKLL